MAQQEKAKQVATLIFIGLLVTLLILVGYFGFKLVSRFAFGGSSGETVAVPDLSGMPEEEAQEALRRLNLAYRTMQRTYSSEQPMGSVFRQKPSPGSRVKPGNKVSYWISLGPPTFTIPDLIGVRIEDVNERLAKLNLQLGNIEKVIAPGLPTGQVISQRPEPGSEYNGVVPVDIVVVDNEKLPEVSMPTLTGKRLGDVERSLVDLNLQLAEVSYVANDEAESGTVISQSVPTGKQVRMGSKLALEVAIPSALKDAPTRSINLRITVPTGPEQQRVKIKFFDALGPQEDYNQMHARGHTIERTIAIEGPATIQIFINDMNEPYRVEKL